MSEWQQFVYPTQRSPAANMVRMELINTIKFWQLPKYSILYLLLLVACTMKCWKQNLICIK